MIDSREVLIRSASLYGEEIIDIRISDGKIVDIGNQQGASESDT